MTPMKRRIRCGVRASVRLLGMWAYLVEVVVVVEEGRLRFLLVEVEVEVVEEGGVGMRWVWGLGLRAEAGGVQGVRALLWLRVMRFVGEMVVVVVAVVVLL